MKADKDIAIYDILPPDLCLFVGNEQNCTHCGKLLMTKEDEEKNREFFKTQPTTKIVWPSRGIVPCGMCYSAHYCSEECRDKDADSHYPLCAIHARLEMGKMDNVPIKVCSQLADKIQYVPGEMKEMPWTKQTKLFVRHQDRYVHEYSEMLKQQTEYDEAAESLDSVPQNEREFTMIKADLKSELETQVHLCETLAEKCIMAGKKAIAIWEDLNKGRSLQNYYERHNVLVNIVTRSLGVANGNIEMLLELSVRVQFSTLPWLVELKKQDWSERWKRACEFDVSTVWGSLNKVNILQNPDKETEIFNEWKNAFQLTTVCARIHTDIITNTVYGLSIGEHMSTITHSARPNAQFIPVGRMFIFRALKNIKEGDEITVNLMQHVQPFSPPKDTCQMWMANTGATECNCGWCVPYTPTTLLPEFEAVWKEEIEVFQHDSEGKTPYQAQILSFMMEKHIEEKLERIILPSAKDYIASIQDDHIVVLDELPELVKSLFRVPLYCNMLAQMLSQCYITKMWGFGLLIAKRVIELARFWSQEHPGEEEHFRLVEARAQLFGYIFIVLSHSANFKDVIDFVPEDNAVDEFIACVYNLYGCVEPLLICTSNTLTPQVFVGMCDSMSTFRDLFKAAKLENPVDVTGALEKLILAE